MDMKNRVFQIMTIFKPSLGSCEDPKKFGTDCLAVLIFIGHKQADRQTIYIILVDQAEDENSLYFIVRTGRSSLQQTVDDWIEEYKVSLSQF